MINPKNMKVERLFPIPLEDCAGPQGMAIGPNDQILEGCNAASPNGPGTPWCSVKRTEVFWRSCKT